MEWHQIKKKEDLVVPVPKKKQPHTPFGTVRE
jgi:hypothetical protein